MSFNFSYNIFLFTYCGNYLLIISFKEKLKVEESYFVGIKLFFITCPDLLGAVGLKKSTSSILPSPKKYRELGNPEIISL